jgi:hypothetical protein
VRCYGVQCDAFVQCDAVRETYELLGQEALHTVLIEDLLYHGYTVVYSSYIIVSLLSQCDTTCSQAQNTHCDTPCSLESHEWDVP